MNNKKLTLDESCDESYDVFAMNLGKIISDAKGDDVSDDTFNKFIYMLKSSHVKNNFGDHMSLKNVRSFMLDILEIKMPTMKQMDILLSFIEYTYLTDYMYDDIKAKIEILGKYAWIDHAKCHGYTFTKNQQQIIEDLGYVDIDYKKLKSTDNKIVKNYIISILKNSSRRKINNIFFEKNVIGAELKNKIIFDDDYLNIIYDIYYKMDHNGLWCDEFYKLITFFGYKHNKYLLDKLFNSSFLESHYFGDIICDHITNDIIPSCEQLIKYINYTTYDIFCALDVMIDKCAYINQQLINTIIYSPFKNNKIIYDRLLNYVIKTNEFKPTYETLLFACQSNNNILFDACITYNIMPNIECMYAACKSSDIGQIKKMINMKININSKCLDACLLCPTKDMQCDVIKLLINEGTNVTKQHIEHIILHDVDVPENCILPYDHTYNVCHIYGLSNKKWITKEMQQNEQYKLRSKVLKYEQYDKIKEFMTHSIKCKTKSKKNVSCLKDLKFDKYCYDTILVTHHCIVLFGKADETNLLYNYDLCDAIKTKEYVITREAIERCANNVHRMQLLKHYKMFNEN
jgi:hypothetical protein